MLRRSVLIVATTTLWASAVTGLAKVPVILDTDIGPDCDDVAAVALLHGLVNRGEARLLAMMCCISSDWGAPCLDALNTYYGRPEIPVGTLKERGFLDGKSYNEVVARCVPHALRSSPRAAPARRTTAGRARPSLAGSGCCRRRVARRPGIGSPAGQELPDQVLEHDRRLRLRDRLPGSDVRIQFTAQMNCWSSPPVAGLGNSRKVFIRSGS